MNKILPLIRYAIRISVFIGLLIPMLFIAYPVCCLLGFIDGERPIDRIAIQVMRDFLNLTVRGE